jgi:hypothetical protein
MGIVYMSNKGAFWTSTTGWSMLPQPRSEARHVL